MNMIEAYTKTSFTTSSVPEENKNIPQPTAETFTKPLNSMESLPTCEDVNFSNPYDKEVDSKSQVADKKSDLTVNKEGTKHQRMQSFESRESKKHKENIPGELLAKGSFVSLGVQQLDENTK